MWLLLASLASAAELPGRCPALASQAWTAIPAAPLSDEVAATLWTGRYLLLLRPDGSGARFDPCAGAWEPVPAAPTPIRDVRHGSGHPAVVAGDRVFFYGPASTSYPDKAFAHVIYEASGNTWRRMTPGSLSAPTTALWTDVGLVAWGWRDEVPGAAPRSVRRLHREEGALYDPATDRWTPIPPLPADLRARMEVNEHPARVLWTGSALVVSKGQLGTASWRPGDASWAVPSDDPGVPLQAARGGLALGYQRTGDAATAVALDPATGTFLPIADPVPLGSVLHHPDRLVVAGEAGLFELDPETRRFVALASELPDLPGARGTMALDAGAMRVGSVHWPDGQGDVLGAIALLEAEGWTTLPSPGIPPRAPRLVVGDEHVVLIWGGSRADYTGEMGGCGPRDASADRDRQPICDEYPLTRRTEYADGAIWRR